MKLRISTFTNIGKFRLNLRNFIHYLRTKLYPDYLQKNVTPSVWAFRAFAGTFFMALRIPVVSMGFSSFLIGPTYPLRICRRQIRPEHDFFVFVVFLDKFMKYW
jgi:hypothetical protein